MNRTMNETMNETKITNEITNETKISNEITNEIKSKNVIEENCDIKKSNVFLANCISIFHTLVVIFVLLAPFSNIPAILILHATFSFCLLVHWWANNNICSLSYMEAKLRGLDHTESFTHKFVAPMYDISKTEWSQICNIVTIILLCISLYSLYHSERVAKSWECYNKLVKDPEFISKSFFTRMINYTDCFKDLFILR